jgi:hypothetical protein
MLAGAGLNQIVPIQSAVAQKFVLFNSLASKEKIGNLWSEYDQSTIIYLLFLFSNSLLFLPIPIMGNFGWQNEILSFSKRVPLF